MKKCLAIVFLFVLISVSFTFPAQGEGFRKKSNPNLGIVEQPFGTVDFDAAYPGFEFYDMSPASGTQLDDLSIGDWLETAGALDFEIVNCNEYVSLRKEADICSDRIMKLWLGESGYAIGTWEEWTLCDINGRYGWVLSEYLYISNDYGDYDYDYEEEDEDAYDEIYAYADSTLTDQYKTYYAYYACDGDLTTAWAEGAEGFGFCQELTFTFDYSKISGIEIASGYQLDRKRFTRNNRPKEIAIYADGEYLGNFFLEDIMGTQDVELVTPVYVSSLTIRILDVFEGSRYDDTCISEVYFY